MEAAAEVAALHEAKETTRKDDPAKSALDGLPLTSGPWPTSGVAMARGAFVAGCLEGARHLLRQFMVQALPPLERELVEALAVGAGEMPEANTERSSRAGCPPSLMAIAAARCSPALAPRKPSIAATSFEGHVQPHQLVKNRAAMLVAAARAPQASCRPSKGHRETRRCVSIA